ncbi:MAG TPA: LapA family protein [Burkholderiales bacterium]|nr:LapA family protein [Burkholderiales bacterium]
MRVITWAIRLALFAALLAFAAKNTDPVTLRFYFGLSWQAPLVLLLLAFFAAGVVLGLAATSGTWFAQRREISRLRRMQSSSRAEPDTRPASQPPAAEG